MPTSARMSLGVFRTIRGCRHPRSCPTLRERILLLVVVLVIGNAMVEDEDDDEKDEMRLRLVARREARMAVDISRPSACECRLLPLKIGGESFGVQFLAGGE